jgi:cytoskeletal protein RodZ
MSDDTPTQRFDAPLTPTTPIATPPEEPTPEDRRRRALMFAFIALSAALLVILIVVLIVLFARGGTPAAVSTPTTTPSASPTPSATPSASPTPTPTQTTAPTPPPSSGPTLTSFASSTDVKCNAANNPIPIDFSWIGTGAAAYIAVGATADPKSNGQGWTLPPTGSQADFPADQDILYPCTKATATYTIGVYDNSGHSVIKQLVVTNHGTVG